MNEIDWKPSWAHVRLVNIHNPLLTAWASSFAGGARFRRSDGLECQNLDPACWQVVATTPSWSGEGLPTVGTIVEATDGLLNNGAWTKVVILAVGKHGKDDCVLMAEVLDDKGRPGQMVASLYTQYEDCFRSIRTPEQIAADEREAAIDAMICDCSYPGSDSTRTACEALYDAGYRKP